MQIDPLWPLCGLEDETPLHVLFHGNLARSIWFGSPLSCRIYQILIVSNGDFGRWGFELIFADLDHHSCLCVKQALASTEQILIQMRGY